MSEHPDPKELVRFYRRLAKAAERTLALIEQGWTRGASARYKPGKERDENICSPHSKKAKCWCITGAMQRATGYNFSNKGSREYYALLDYSDSLIKPDANTSVWWNDHFVVNKSQVLAHCRKMVKHFKLRLLEVEVSLGAG